ncbi:MAG: leucine-rich repeat domain-containing protein [Candidatus Omnitrophota bacterium]
MKKITLWLFIIIIVLNLSNFIFGSIPESERGALIALYHNTNGDGWINKSGWKTPPLDTDGFARPGTEGSWYGVTLSGNHVRLLVLPSNRLVGKIPQELGRLEYLKELVLNNNQLSKTIPYQLSNLGQLTRLCLQYNKLSGAIPVEIGNLQQLVELSLNNNQLSGSIPSELGYLSQLANLYLQNNRLTNCIPSKIGNLVKLKELLLNNNQLIGVIPSELGYLTQLIKLSLKDNQLTGCIPYQLGNLENLKELSLSNNQLSGSIPLELANLSRLQTLSLPTNQLTGCIPYQFGALERLTGLYLQENQLSGTIPYQLGNLGQLKELLLNNNRLDGAIPGELANIRNLQTLNLDTNQLIGNIPYELGSLTQLKELSLANNQLSGEIPYQIGFLKKLLRLNFQNNKLNGIIPPDLGNLDKLQSLNLYHNQLTDSIPNELCNLHNLQSLNLGSNQLSGDVPACLTNLTNISFLNLGFNCLSAASSTLRDWLSNKDPNWEANQDNCDESKVPRVNNKATKTYTISGNAGVSGATLTYIDRTAKSVASDSNGNYTLTVSVGWTGTVTPSKSSYTFTPASKAYNRVSGNKTLENYKAIPITYAISGNVGVSGVILSYTDGTSKSVTSDSTGNFTLTVSRGWSGTVTPSSPCYTFSPASKTYNRVSANKALESYKAIPRTNTISGNVGVSGVILSYTDGISKSVTSDSTGNYTLTVSCGWSGTVTPSKSCYIFNPVNKTYNNISANKALESYKAIPMTYTISGNVGVSGAILSYTDGVSKSVTSDNSGNYTLTIPCGWSGVIVPSKPSYNFTPASKSYSSVSAIKKGDDYTATLITYTISGSVKDSLGVGISGVALNYTDGTIKSVTTNSSGIYTLPVPCNWSGTVTPTREGQAFTPASATYTNVKTNQATHYKVTRLTYKIKGRIIKEGNGLANVKMVGLPGGPLTDKMGNYSAAVEHGFSGTVTPTLEGYVFAEPPTKYANVKSDQTTNYTATSSTYKIAGQITKDGKGLAKVKMVGFPEEVETDKGGNYAAMVETGWSGTVIPTLDVYAFTPSSTVYTNVTSDDFKDYTATPLFTLKVKSTPIKEIDITVSPADESGRGNGTTEFERSYLSGTEVTLTAPEKAGTKVFSKWNVKGDDRKSQTITVKMDSDKMAHAIYVDVYTLTVQSNPTGVIISPGGATEWSKDYPSGTVVSLTAPEKSGTKVFSKWTVNDIDASTSLTLNVTMDGPKTAVAIYVELYKLTVQSDPTGVTIPPGGSTEWTDDYQSGTVVSLTAPEKVGTKVFSKWTVNGAEASKSPTLSVTMDGAKTAVAIYVDVYALTVQSNPTGVTISPGGATQWSQNYPSGTIVNLSAPATFGTKVFSKWTVNGADASTSPTLSVTMNGTKTAVAIYVDVYALTVQSNPTGVTISPGGATPWSQNYPSGTIVNLSAPTTFGTKVFSKWTVNGADASTSPILSVTMNGAKTAVAIYVDVYALTVQSNPTGVTISPGGATPWSQNYPSGTIVNLSAPATSGTKVFSKWTVNNIDVSTSLTLSVTMNGNKTAEAVYVEGCTLTVQSTPVTGIQITVSPNSPNWIGIPESFTNFTKLYKCGTVVTLTAPATYGTKVFSKWTVNGADYTSQSISVAVSGNTTAVATYVDIYTLNIQSMPDTGISIAVSPVDRNGQGNGITNFTRSYTSGTLVFLTAPATVGTKVFSKWAVNSVDYFSQTIPVTMNENKTAVAIYVDAVYTLSVQSTPDTGVSITVSPTDQNGQGSGSTNFTRTYVSGTTVTLTAPGEIIASGGTASGAVRYKIFSKWTVDGVDYFSQTIPVTMNGNRTAVATYVDLYTLAVQSTPITGVNITVSPTDQSGQGNGSTNFTRSYKSGTTVTLTAPGVVISAGAARGVVFSKWTVDGIDYPSPTISVTMSGNKTAVATYVDKFTLTVKVDNGALGNIAPGTYTYNSGDKVSYSFSLDSSINCDSITVKLTKPDGSVVESQRLNTITGSIPMDGNYTLEVIVWTKLSVSVWGPYTYKYPDSGYYYHRRYNNVGYSYRSSNFIFHVFLDGATVSSGGTITMDRNHDLEVLGGDIPV